MKNSQGMQVELITLGATLTSLKIPDKNGNLDDIVLGFNDVAGTNVFFYLLGYYFTRCEMILMDLFIIEKQTN